MNHSADHRCTPEDVAHLIESLTVDSDPCQERTCERCKVPADECPAERASYEGSADLTPILSRDALADYGGSEIFGEALDEYQEAYRAAFGIFG